MRIGVNASFSRKPDSGMGQVALNFLKKLSEAEAQKAKSEKVDREIILYLEEDIDLKLPDNFSKRIIKPVFYERDDLIRKIWWEKYLLPRAVKADSCDVLLSLYQAATIVPTVRHVMLVHDIIWKIFPDYLNNFRKKLYYSLVEKAIVKADSIITISNHSKSDIEKILFRGSAREKITVVYPDCDPLYAQKIEQGDSARIVERYGIDQKAPFIFYVGGFDIRKNINNLIDSYGRLWALFKEKQIEEEFPLLVLAGEFRPHLVPLVTDIPAKSREAQQRYGLPDNKIVSLGFVDQRDLPAFYSRARVFCYPSLYEGFGLPPVEAMNCGCPVVMSNNSSLAELATEREVLFVDSQSSQAISQALYRVVTDNALRERLVENARDAVKKFDWQRFYFGVMKVVEKG